MRQIIRFLIIDSAYPINTRNIKIANSLCKHYSDREVQMIFCAWNREDKNITSPNNYYIYKKYSPGGQLLRKLFNLFGYFRYLKKCNKCVSPDVIVASHWDMLFLSSIFKKKSQILIYENLDIPSADSSVLLTVLKIVERFALRNTDMIVFASRFYKSLYRSEKYVHSILENKPLLSASHISEHERNATRKINISYIGGVRYLEILKNLVSAVKDNSDVNLFFHGEGHDLKALEKYSEGIDNVYFTGRYEYDKIEYLYYNSDIVWAAYPNKDCNVKYAISNKFHESLHYNVPCIFSEKTSLGDLVLRKEIGFVVDPYSVEKIRELLGRILEEREVLSLVKYKMQEYVVTEKDWESQFQDFTIELNKLIDK